MTTPRQRFWHEGEDSDLSIEIYHAEKQKNIIQSKNISQNEIAEFAEQIDKGETELVKK